MRASRQQPRGFTLIELLVVITIISVLSSILMPSLMSAKDLARRAKCLVALRGLGSAGALYQADNDGQFWPYLDKGYYFWGKPSSPVDTRGAAFMKYLDYDLGRLWCPNLTWGSYVPQGGVNEPTTCYGYNAWALFPSLWGRKDSDGKLMPIARIGQIKNPSKLFVFADSALYWKIGGVNIMQNSTSLDPVSTTWGPNLTPTTHFRHQGKTAALCADGHADMYGLEGGQMLKPQQNIGFVGAANAPHYDND